MDKRRVGQTKLEIDSLGLGGAPLGGNFVDLGYAQAEELIQAAKNIGIGYFDTAPWYGFGRSERVMGDVLRGSEYILSDKVGRLLAPGPVKNPADFGMACASVQAQSSHGQEVLSAAAVSRVRGTTRRSHSCAWRKNRHGN